MGGSVHFTHTCSHIGITPNCIADLMCNIALDVENNDYLNTIISEEDLVPKGGRFIICHDDQLIFNALPKFISKTMDSDIDSMYLQHTSCPWLFQGSPPSWLDKMLLNPSHKYGRMSRFIFQIRGDRLKLPHRKFKPSTAPCPLCEGLINQRCSRFHYLFHCLSTKDWRYYMKDRIADGEAE